MAGRLRDIIGSIVVLLVLFGVLIAINPAVRDWAGGFAGAGRGQQLGGVAQGVGKVLHTAGLATLSYAGDNPILFGFAVVSVLMFGLMLRT